MNLPALRAHLRERARKRRRHRAHQVVDLPRRPAPVDAAILRAAAPEVLPGSSGCGRRGARPAMSAGSERASIVSAATVTLANTSRASSSSRIGTAS